MNKTLVALVAPYGGVVLVDNATHTNRFEIPASSGMRRYLVAQAVTSGEWQCSCPGWVFKKKSHDRRCKHLTAMTPVLSKIGQIA